MTIAYWLLPQSICCLFSSVILLFSVSQLSEARDKTLEGVKRKVDYKELKGKDPSTAELAKKIEQVRDTFKILLYCKRFRREYKKGVSPLCLCTVAWGESSWAREAVAGKRTPGEPGDPALKATQRASWQLPRGQTLTGKEGRLLYIHREEALLTHRVIQRQTHTLPHNTIYSQIQRNILFTRYLQRGLLSLFVSLTNTLTHCLRSMCRPCEERAEWAFGSSLSITVSLHSHLLFFSSSAINTLIKS